MTNRTNIRQAAAAAFGAILLSTAFVSAAVGPAHAVAPIAASAQVSGQEAA